VPALSGGVGRPFIIMAVRRVSMNMVAKEGEERREGSGD
jgi:hypothetical protein